MEIRIASIAQLPEVAQQFLVLTAGKRIFAFEGHMGAGKTTFILELLHAMGIEETEGSPTYSLVNTYESATHGIIYHFDLFRLNSTREALDIGMEEMLFDNAICLIEWPEKIKELLPDHTIWSYIRVNDDNSRTLIIDL